jgi:hypothetical protein
VYIVSDYKSVWKVQKLEQILHWTIIISLDDFGYAVLALWFSCSQKLLGYLAFQSFHFECNC